MTAFTIVFPVLVVITFVYIMSLRETISDMHRHFPARVFETKYPRKVELNWSWGLNVGVLMIAVDDVGCASWNPMSGLELTCRNDMQGLTNKEWRQIAEDCMVEYNRASLARATGGRIS